MLFQAAWLWHLMKLEKRQRKYDFLHNTKLGFCMMASEFSLGEFV